MTVIGIHGPSGAGKGVLAHYLSEKYNIQVINADEVYKKLLTPPSKCLDALEEAFGKSILLPDGGLYREALGHIVFNDAEKLELLNSISHKYIVEKIRSILRTFRHMGVKLCAIDAPLLCESGLCEDCDIVISVLADRSIRIERIMKRDGITEERASERVEAQKSDEFYISKSTYTIYNNSGEKQLCCEADEIITSITSKR